MKNWNIRFIPVCLSLLSMTMAEFGGGYAGASYRYSSNARHFALAGAMVAEPNWGFHQFGNPALITHVSQNEVSSSLMSLSLDRSIQVISFSRQLPPDAAVGLSVFRAGTGNIEGRDSMGEATSNYSASDISAMLTFSRKLTEKFSAGLNLKILFNNLDNNLDATGIAFDFGATYEIAPGWDVGIKMDNITGKNNWKYDGGATVSEDLLSTISVGASISRLPKVKIVMQSDTYFIPGGSKETKFRFGGEYPVTNDFTFRAGLNGAKLSAGFGMNFHLKHKYKLRLDYALDPGYENEGISHLYSLSMRI